MSGLFPTISQDDLRMLHAAFRDPMVLAVIGGFVVLVLFLMFHPSARYDESSGPPTIVLTGPPDAGKTALFAKTALRAYPQTQTSMKPSQAYTSVADSKSSKRKLIRLIDVPGHPRLQDEAKAFLQDARAVVFVVDVVALVKNAGTVAELLPPLLTTLASSRRHAKLLILAHKADLLIRPTPPSSPFPPDLPDSTRTTAIDRARSLLTREMDRLKSSRAGGVGGRIEALGKVAGGGGGGWWNRLFGSGGAVSEGEEGEDETLVWGGDKAGFSWGDVEGVEVTWGCSGLGMIGMGGKGDAEEKAEEGNGLRDLTDFLGSV